MLNSTWASNRATTGAVAALQPLTLERIRPSCFECRTTLINPGRLLFVCDTKSSSFSFSSSKIKFKSTEFKIDGGRGFFFLKIYICDTKRDKSEQHVSNIRLPQAVTSSSTGQYFRRATLLMLQFSDHWTREEAADFPTVYQSRLLQYEQLRPHCQKTWRNHCNSPVWLQVYSHHELLDQIFFDTNVGKKKKKIFFSSWNWIKLYKQYH